MRTGGLPYKDAKGNPYGKRFFHHHKPNRQIISRKQGIPQGGVLSGMLANLYLHEFDCWVVNELSQKYVLRYVRYADDFVILVKNIELLPSIHDEVEQKLQHIGLELHGEPKTKHVDIEKQSLEFVGFEFTTEHIRVKADNIRKFQERILEKIEKEPTYKWKGNPKERFKSFIDKVIIRKVLGCSEKIEEKEICQECGGVIGEQVRSWMGFFMAITDVQQLRQLDKWIRSEISKHFYKQYKIRLKRSDFKAAGLASLEQEYYRLHKRKKCKSCSCDRSNSPVNSTDDGKSATETESETFRTIMHKFKNSLCIFTSTLWEGLHPHG